MAVAPLINCKWLFTAALLAVLFYDANVYLGGSLASDDLYLLDLRNGDQAAQWMIVPIVG